MMMMTTTTMMMMMIIIIIIIIIIIMHWRSVEQPLHVPDSNIKCLVNINETDRQTDIVLYV